MNTITSRLTAEEIRDLVGTAPLMLEIGSHDGSDTVKFLGAMPAARIVCFEPDPRPVVEFTRRLEHDSRVKLFCEAVAESDGETAFYASTGEVGEHEDWDFSGSLQRATGHLLHSPEIKFKDPVTIQCMRLDTWLTDFNVGAWSITGPDFIWADVQGGQRRLIAGGRTTLALTRYLYLECHHEPLYENEPTQDELIAMLPGFEPLAIYELDNILFRNRHWQ